MIKTGLVGKNPTTFDIFTQWQPLDIIASLPLFFLVILLFIQLKSGNSFPVFQREINFPTTINYTLLNSMSNSSYTMKVKFYGTRGSIPVCSRDFLDFGGNTSCLSISLPDSDVLSIIDAGTGIRNLGKELMQDPDNLPKEITVGFSHFHWDHIQGFPFFTPAYNPNVRLNILVMGPEWKMGKLKKIMVDQMGGAFFPIEVNEMGANFNYLAMGSRIVHNRTGMSVKSRLHQHPGGAHSFRIERNGKVLVLVTDIEHGDTIDPGTVELARGADLLIHEAQYTMEELATRKGWGHSSYEQAIEVARLAGAKQLVMTHHDPEHDDAFLLKMEKKCQRIFPDCRLAREMMEIEI